MKRSSALALLLTLAACGRAGAPVAQRPNVLIVTFDTTRADHIGCYGNTSIETPTIDRLAAEGCRFENAVTAAPITCPSHSTIMTGKYPIAHGVRDNGLFVLAPERETLAEILKRNGYATAAAVGAFPLARRFGLDQGFDLYDDRFNVAREDHEGRATRAKTGIYFDERRAALVNEAVLPWVETHAGAPFFLWVHYFDAHQPHDPPPPYAELYADDLYDGEIAYADETLGQLLSTLDRKKVLDRTLVVFTADHGEGLGEHDESTHSMLLYQGTLHVPLVVRAPGAPPAVVVAERVGTVDIVPTILDLLGVTAPAGLQGRSLAPMVRGEKPPPDDGRVLYAETLSPRLTNGWGELRAIFQGSRKYVHGPRAELFDLVADPAEKQDLSGTSPADAKAMRDRLAAFLAANASASNAPATPVDEETRQRLMALGYLASEAPVKNVVDVLKEEGTPPQDRVKDVSDISMAKQFLYQGRALEGREILTSLTARDPGNASYHEMLAMADVMLGLVDEALAEVTKIRTGAEGRAVSEPLVLQLVKAMFATGRRDEASGLLREVQAGRPTADGQYLLSLLSKEMGDDAGRRAALEKALALDPKHGPARIDRAVDLALAGKRGDAERELTQATRDDPYDARAFYNLGTFRVEEEDLDAAARHFERAILLDPRYLRARLALAVVDLDQGDRAAAEKQIAEIRALAPGSDEDKKGAELLKEPERP
ncbi:MAG: sulfatase-like hydrolase/transferase [Acidobacteriota bacterium]